MVRCLGPCQNQAPWVVRHLVIDGNGNRSKRARKLSLYLSLMHPHTHTERERETLATRDLPRGALACARFCELRKPTVSRSGLVIGGSAMMFTIGYGLVKRCMCMVGRSLANLQRRDGAHGESPSSVEAKDDMDVRNAALDAELQGQHTEHLIHRKQTRKTTN